MAVRFFERSLREDMSKAVLHGQNKIVQFFRFGFYILIHVKKISFTFQKLFFDTN